MIIQCGGGWMYSVYYAKRLAVAGWCWTREKAEREAGLV
jgi:hypothetical protein